MKRNDGKNMKIPIQIPSPSEFVLGIIRNTIVQIFTVNPLRYHLKFMIEEKTV